MTWQLTGSGLTWIIKDADNHHVATLTYCDLAPARLLCAAQEMREALKLAEVADFLSQPGHNPRKAIEMLEAMSDFQTGWVDYGKGIAARKYRKLARAARQRALRLAAGGTDENPMV